MMTGNVSGIVESFFTADNMKNQQRMVNSNSGTFSDYLDLALLNRRAGFLSGSTGLGVGYSGFNALSGSIWQSVVLKALQEQIKQSGQKENFGQIQQENKAEGAGSAQKRKPDWAAIRVTRSYQSPLE